MRDTKQLEKFKEDLNEVKDRAEMAQRLYKNKDFKKLILEYFCRDECARYVHTSADPSLPKENRDDALALAQASGHFLRFMSVVVTMGDTANKELENIDDAIAESRIENQDSDTSMYGE